MRKDRDLLLNGMKAFLKNYRQSPRKVRLLADLIRGKNTKEAIVSLDFLPKRASLPIKKLLSSAIANAKNTGKDVEKLFVKNITVDKGIVLKRMMPRAMGRGARINKRTSNINIILEEKIIKEDKKENKVVKKNKLNLLKKKEIKK